MAGCGGLNGARVGCCHWRGGKRLCGSPVKDPRIYSEISGNALKSSEQESDPSRFQVLN